MACRSTILYSQSMVGTLYGWGGVGGCCGDWALMGGFQVPGCLDEKISWAIALESDGPC